MSTIISHNIPSFANLYESTTEVFRFSVKQEIGFPLLTLVPSPGLLTSSKYRIAASTLAIRPGDFFLNPGVDLLRLVLSELRQHLPFFGKRSVASLTVEYEPNDHDRVDSSGLLIPIGTLFNSPAIGSRL